MFSLSWIRSAINWVVGSNTQQEDAESDEKSHNPDSNPPIVYSGQLYYQPEDSNQWFIVKLIVFRSLKEGHEVRILFLIPCKSAVTVCYVMQCFISGCREGLLTTKEVDSNEVVF